jgi:hypothetical protein
MPARKIKDDDGVVVTPGCRIAFSYSIPPVPVEAEVIERDGKIIALTPGHNPPECPVAKLQEYVWSFWVVEQEAEDAL